MVLQNVGYFLRLNIYQKHNNSQMLQTLTNLFSGHFHSHVQILCVALVPSRVLRALQP